MSETKPSNPPIITSGDQAGVYSPVTLRDLFAAAALAGMFANPNYDASSLDFAKMAYDDATAMLAERERREGE